MGHCISAADYTKAECIMNAAEWTESSRECILGTLEGVHSGYSRRKDCGHRQSGDDMVMRETRWQRQLGYICMHYMRVPAKNL